MANKHWVARAVQSLEESLSPVPHESNEIDWKVSLSDRKERLAEHLMAFANHANGGFLAFGVGDTDARLESIGQEAVAEIANTLANLGRDAVEPPLVIDHMRKLGRVLHSDIAEIGSPKEPSHLTPHDHPLLSETRRQATRHLVNAA